MDQRRILPIFQARLLIRLHVVDTAGLCYLRSSLCCAIIPHHSSPASVTHIPQVYAFLRLHWVLTPSSNLLKKNCRFCDVCITHTLNITGDRMYALHFDTKLLRATWMLSLTSFIPTHESFIKAKVHLFQKMSCKLPTEVYCSQEWSHLLLSSP